ncbi:MAG: F0F1 ATP synthase subunit delta [Lachnospiraceae bacterium]|nr:F0F1 ATP synthase subunit delta [Lachnospiraceae bacterium]
MAKLVSKVYGDALFSLAVEEDKLELLRNEADVIKQAVGENPELLSVLCHPEMSQEKKLSMLEEMFKKDMSEEMMGFLNVLVRKGRIRELLPVLEYFEAQVKEYLKIGVVNVSTPLPLSDSQKEQVENKLLAVSQYETLEIHYQIDESLLGGMVIRIGDRVLDNSIRSKMGAMSRQLSKVRLSS